MGRYLPAGMTLTDLALFAGICSAFALIALFLDWVLQIARGTSLIDIGYKNKSAFIVVPAWCLAAGIVGGIGATVQILQTNLLAAISVAVGWPLILARIIQLGASPPTQQPTQEEKEQ